MRSMEGQVEGIDRHIANVGDHQAVERRGARRHVVGANRATARIWRGPKRVPARLEVPISSGTPTKQASSPAVTTCDGRRIMVAGRRSAASGCRQGAGSIFPSWRLPQHAGRALVTRYLGLSKRLAIT